jgi:hypothetical protein
MEETQVVDQVTQGENEDVTTNPRVENWLEIGRRADKIAEFCDKQFDDDFITTLDALFYLACANLKGIGIEVGELHEAVDAAFTQVAIPESHKPLPTLNGAGK